MPAGFELRIWTEFGRFVQKDWIGGKGSTKSTSVSPLIPLYALLSISFLHLIPLSFHFLFLIPQTARRGRTFRAAVIWRWSIASHSRALSHLISHVEISGIGYLCATSINHAETLQLCAFKFQIDCDRRHPEWMRVMVGTQELRQVSVKLTESSGTLALNKEKRFHRRNQLFCNIDHLIHPVTQRLSPFSASSF